MTRKILALAAAVALLAPATMIATPAAFAQTAPAEQAQAPTLPTVTKANFADEIKQSDKPVLVIVTAANCGSCPAVIEALAAQAAKNPDWKFMQAQASEFDMPEDLLPFVVVLGKDAEQIYDKANFDLPADMDAFIATRKDGVAKLTAAQAQIADIEKKIADASAPFNDEMKVLQGKADVIAKPFKDRLEANSAARVKALEPINEKIRDVRTRRAALEKTFEDQISEVTGRLETATADLNTEWQSLQDKVRDLRNQGVASDNADLVAARARITAIEAEYAEKAKPFDAETAAIEAKAEEALKPFAAEEAAARQERRDAVTPFDEEANKIRTEAGEALKELRAQAAEVNKRRTAALGSLPADLEKSEDALYELKRQVRE